MKRILASISAALIVVAGTVSCNNDPKADGVAQITSFSLQASLNSTLSSNVTGDIDEQAKTISIVLPEGSGSEFIPTFTATDDDVVKAGSTELTSGVTSISVTDGTKLSVTDEVSELSVAYTLSVKENDGAAELKSVSFLKADNSALSEDVVPEAVAAEMIVRVPSAAFRQELTLTVEAGLNDVVKVNGVDAVNGKVKVDTSFPIDITVTDEVAKTTANYVLKVGKVLEYVVSKVATITDGTKIYSDIDLAVNPKDNTPWVIYRKEIEGSKYNRVSVMRLEGGSFQFVGESCISPDVKDAKAPSLIFANDGTPYLKYAGGDVANKNTVKKFTSSSWETIGNEGFNSATVNSSLSNNPMYFQSNGQPAFFYCANSGTNRRSIVSATFDGSNWVEKLAAASGIAPKYGEGATSAAGVYYGSTNVVLGGKTYMLASFNMWGYFVYEIGDASALTPVVYDFKPGSSQYGLPGNLTLSTDGENLYVFAADLSASKMQVYKVDINSKTMTEYGEGLSVTIDSNGGITGNATFSASPSGLLVSAINDSDKNTYFKYLNSNLQWENFPTTEKLAATTTSPDFRIVFDSEGTGYVAYTSSENNKIEVYKIALEADVLPE